MFKTSSSVSNSTREKKYDHHRQNRNNMKQINNQAISLVSLQELNTDCLNVLASCILIPQLQGQTEPTHTH